jgi:hypothetical protein
MNFHDFFAEIIEIAEPDGGFGVALATFAPSATPPTLPPIRSNQHFSCLSRLSKKPAPPHSSLHP